MSIDIAINKESAASYFFDSNFLKLFTVRTVLIILFFMVKIYPSGTKDDPTRIYKSQINITTDQHLKKYRFQWNKNIIIKHPLKT